MLEYNSKYKVLVCSLHRYAVTDPDEHLRTCHAITGGPKDALLQQWKDLDILAPEKQLVPAQGKMPRDWLADSKYGFACTSCPFLTIKWLRMASHAKTHGWNLPNAIPRERWPTESCARVEVQTLFPYPHIQWFTVDMSGDFEMGEDSQDDKVSSMLTHQVSPVYTTDSSHEMSANDRAKEDEEINQVIRKLLQERQEANMGWPRKKEVQGKNAQANKVANSRLKLFDRFPLEIRQQIYGLALNLGTTYHIADTRAPVKPELGRIVGTDQHDEDGPVTDDHMDVRDAWEDTIDEDVAYPDDTNILRAIATPAENKNCTALLKTCTQISQEASPIFYRRNSFIIHSRHQNFETAKQFIDNLAPETRRHVSSFGAMALQPCLPNGAGRYGYFPRTEDFELRSQYYYHSERAFLSRVLPELTSLRELTLGFDLSHLNHSQPFEETEEENRDLFSPQAFWLNKFLRLQSLSRINLLFAFEEWKYGMMDVGCTYLLIEQLNRVDGQTRIRAKEDSEDEYPHYEAQRLEQEAEEEAEYGPIYPFLDIWA